MAVRIRFRGMEELRADLRRAGSSARPLMEKALSEAAMRLQSEMRNQLKQGGTIYKGQLGQSIRVSGTGLSREVGTNKVYAGVIATGKRSGAAPPSKALEDWARLKLGKSGLGFVIARKIGKTGAIRGKNPFVENGVEQAMGYINLKFEMAHRAVTKIIEG